MRWMEPLIDFGREVYLPWRIVEGEHLGRDFVHPYGPLSVYFNAGLFSLCGGSIRTLVIANLIIFGCVLISTYALVRRAFGFFAAVSAVLILLPTFGLSHLSTTGNYSFAAPYSHEATHGMVLLLLLLWLLVKVPLRRFMPGFLVGLVVGLLCLTKTEYVVTLVALGGAIGWKVIQEPLETRCRVIWAVGVFVGALTTILSAIAALTPALGLPTAVRTALTGILAPLFYPSYAKSAHVLHYLGANHLGKNAVLIAVWSTAAVAIMLVVPMLFRRAQQLGSSRVKIGLWMTVAVGCFAAAWVVAQEEFGYAFPGLMAGSGWFLWRRISQERTKNDRISSRSWVQLLLFLAATAMLARMVLAPKIIHYGFFQALLATVWVASWLLIDWPNIAGRDRIERASFRNFAALGIAGMVFSLLSTSLSHFRLKQTPIGQGADQIFGYHEKAYPRHALWEQVRHFLAVNGRPGASLLVLPEGVSLNYFTRLKHPLRILDLLPATLPMNNTDVESNLRSAAPEWVVLVKRDDTEDLGFSTYGTDQATGSAIVAWVIENYTPVVRVGNFPFDPSAKHTSGVWVLRRSDVR